VSLKLGKIFLRPSPQFTFRHVSPHKKVNNCLRIEFNYPLSSMCAAQGDRRWFWTITARVPQSTADRGYAASHELAMADFKARWNGVT